MAQIRKKQVRPRSPQRRHLPERAAMEAAQSVWTFQMPLPSSRGNHLIQPTHAHAKSPGSYTARPNRNRATRDLIDRSRRVRVPKAGTDRAHRAAPPLSHPPQIFRRATFSRGRTPLGKVPGFGERSTQNIPRGRDPCALASWRSIYVSGWDCEGRVPRGARSGQAGRQRDGTEDRVRRGMGRGGTGVAWSAVGSDGTGSETDPAKDGLFSTDLAYSAGRTHAPETGIKRRQWGISRRPPRHSPPPSSVSRPRKTAPLQRRLPPVRAEP